MILPSIPTLAVLARYPAPLPQQALVLGNPSNDLPKTEQQAHAIAALLGAQEVLMRDEATVGRVLQRIEQARWMHFACHGQPGTTPPSQPHSVLQGSLLLASDAEHEEGSLDAYRVAQLQLDAELVCMSADCSGSGKRQREGSIGLVWAFLAAGARATMATYWSLEDHELAGRLMEKFYQQMLATGERKVNKAQALQQAMQMMIAEARDRPDQWGAFFLAGLV